MAQRFCTKCGAPLKEGIKFCVSCGEPIKQEHKHVDSGSQELKNLIRKVKRTFAITFAILPIILFFVGFIFGIVWEPWSDRYCDRILFGFEPEEPVWVLGHITYFLLFVAVVFYFIAVLINQKSKAAKIIFNIVALACNIYILIYAFIRLPYSNLYVGWLLVGIMNAVSVLFVLFNLLISIFGKQDASQKPMSKKLSILYVVSSLVVTGAMVSIVAPTVFVPASQYRNALNLLDTDVDKSIEIFEDLSFGDSAKQVTYAKARKAFQEKNYIKGIEYMKREDCQISISYKNGNMNFSYYDYDNNVVKNIKSKRPFDGWDIDYYFYNNNWCVDLNFSNKLSESLYFVSKDYSIDGVEYTEYIVNKHRTTNNPLIYLESVKLPSTFLGYPVTTIGDAFKGDRIISSLSIPTSITSIYSEAFYGCTSLFEITYEGSVYEWELIHKDSDWNLYSSLSVIHCQDGDISIS